MDKKAKMYQLAALWKESGISRPAFAKQHGITLRSLEYWCKKQRREQANQPPVSPSFIEIAGSVDNILENRLAQIEIELPGGLRIKIY